MILKDKNIVIYGAGGSLASAIAPAMAAAGARMFLTGCRLQPVDRLAAVIRAAGGTVDIACVDALVPAQVEAHLEEMIHEGGSVDCSFNLIHLQDVQGVPLIEMEREDFFRPMRRSVESHFITATAAGRYMRRRHAGVILSLTATPGGIGYPNTGGFGPACRFIESLSLGLAAELGSFNVRAVNIRSAGSPDSKVFRDAIEKNGERAADFIGKIEDDTMLKRMPLMKDIANTAVFLASDLAAGITGVTVDVTCGTTTSLNYKAPPIAFARE